MTKVKISNCSRAPGMRQASIDIPLVVGDVPGALRVACAHESPHGALASAATVAQHLLADLTIGAVVPDATHDDVAAMLDIGLNGHAGAATPSQRRLAAALARMNARDNQTLEVGGFFDSIASLAKKAVSATVKYADPDSWPDSIKNIAKPLARAAINAGAVAVFGPAGPAVVATMENVVDQARAGDKDAQAKLQKVATRALKGDDAAKLLMSVVHLDHADKSDNKVGDYDAADDYMARYGAALDPASWNDDGSYNGPDYDDAQAYADDVPGVPEGFQPDYRGDAQYPDPYDQDQQDRQQDQQDQAPDPGAIRDHRAAQAFGQGGPGAQALPMPAQASSVVRSARSGQGGVTITQGQSRAPAQAQAPQGGAFGFGRYGFPGGTIMQRRNPNDHRGR